MFLNPNLTPDARKLIYAYVTYGLMWVAYSAINIPYSALMGVMSPSSEQRTSLSTYRFICAFVGQFLIVQLVVPLKKLLGRGNEAEGIRYTMLIFAVVSVALFLYTFANTRERVSAAGRTRRAPSVGPAQHGEEPSLGGALLLRPLHPHQCGGPRRIDHLLLQVRGAGRVEVHVLRDERLRGLHRRGGLHEAFSSGWATGAR